MIAEEVGQMVANEVAKRQRWDVCVFVHSPVFSIHFCDRCAHYPSLFPKLYLVSRILTSSLAIQFENSLRRHNHLGLIHALLLAMAKSGTLDKAVDGARTAMKTRVEARRAAGLKGADLMED